MITVMGATGNTGSKIAARLVKAGERVRVVGRSESRLAELVNEGAEPFVGDASAPEFLTSAFRGADAVYTLVPFDPAWPDYHAAADRLGEGVAAAVRDSGVPHVVALSSLGADLPVGTGFIVSLYRQEERLRRLADTNVLVLRPGLFFEGFAGVLELIRNEGINGDSVAPETRIPMIATRDIADVAVGALRSRDWTGFVVRELLGQRDLSYAEITTILGERIGKPDLRYIQFPEADTMRALTEAGLSADVASLVVEMNRAMSDRTIKSMEGRRSANTTPTRFEDFADELARAYSEGQA